MDGMHGWTFDEAPFCQMQLSVNAFLKHFAEGAVVGAVLAKDLAVLRI
jgi:hypothetical protein